MKKLLCAATLVASSFVATSAFATNPLLDPTLIPAPPTTFPTPGGFDCTTVKPEANSQFNTGFNASYLLMWQAWVGSGMDRNNVASFLSQASTAASGQINSGLVSLDPVANPMQNSIGCRFWGGLSGVTQAVSDILTAVITSCGTDGNYYGPFAAKIYCELADLFGPLAAAPLLARNTGTCSTAYEPACTGAFDAMTGVYITPGGTTCSTLTSGPYMAGHNSTRWNECTF